MATEEEKQEFLDDWAKNLTMGFLLNTIEQTEDPVATARAICLLMGADLKALDAQIAESEKDTREQWAFRELGSENPN